MINLDLPVRNKQLIQRFRAALYDCDPAALPGQLRDDPGSRIDLDDHLTTEMLTVLADTCSDCDAAAVAGVVAMLRHHFGIAADVPAATAVATLLQELAGRQAREPAACAALLPWAQRLAAAVADGGAA